MLCGGMGMLQLFLICCVGMTQMVGEKTSKRPTRVHGTTTSRSVTTSRIFPKLTSKDYIPPTALVSQHPFVHAIDMSIPPVYIESPLIKEYNCLFTRNPSQLLRFA